MKKEIEDFEYNGLKFSVEELDALQALEFEDSFSAISELHTKNEEEAVEKYNHAFLKLVIDMFKIPNITIDGEKVTDIAYFLKKISINKAIGLYTDINTIGVMRPEDEGK